MKLEVRSHEVRRRNHEVRSSNELPGLLVVVMIKG